MNPNPIDALHRWRHRHGYGVHSPWAYEFVRDVLFATCRCDTLDALRGTVPDEQLFRAARWLQVDRFLLAGISDTGHRYILTARPAAQILPFAPDIRPTESDCAIIDGICAGQRDLWQRILDQPQRTTAFDIRMQGGGRGIALFSPARQRQLYTL